jgi:hypothetical protein
MREFIPANAPKISLEIFGSVYETGLLEKSSRQVVGKD